MKREAELKVLFAKELKRQAPGFLLLSYLTNGAPDREVVGNGRTSRWEFKHATPDFESPGNQELMCMRLAAAAHCRYVVWHEFNGVKRTLIVHPRVVHACEGMKVNLEAEASCIGFDMKWLVEYIAKEHGA